jgi:hypothetical protein
VWQHPCHSQPLPGSLHAGGEGGESRPADDPSDSSPGLWSGAEPTTTGWRRTLTWRGLAVAPPFHWHCSRNGQGRQLRMLAPYTTRKLPSASRRRSWATRGWLAGQRRVPSDWSTKSCPEKRPALKATATVGLPYPQVWGGSASISEGAGANERRCVSDQAATDARTGHANAALLFARLGCVATTTRQRRPSGPTGTFGQS